MRSAPSILSSSVLYELSWHRRPSTGMTALSVPGSTVVCNVHAAPPLSFFNVPLVAITRSSAMLLMRNPCVVVSMRPLSRLTTSSPSTPLRQSHPGSQNRRGPVLDSCTCTGYSLWATYCNSSFIGRSPAPSLQNCCPSLLTTIAASPSHRHS